jgi:hypothetical protein
MIYIVILRMNKKDAGRPSYKGVYTSRVRVNNDSILVYITRGGYHTYRSAQIIHPLKCKGVGGSEH